MPLLWLPVACDVVVLSVDVDGLVSVDMVLPLLWLAGVINEMCPCCGWLGRQFGLF